MIVEDEQEQTEQEPPLGQTPEASDSAGTRENGWLQDIPRAQFAMRAIARTHRRARMVGAAGKGEQADETQTTDAQRAHASAQQAGQEGRSRSVIE